MGNQSSPTPLRTFPHRLLTKAVRLSNPTHQADPRSKRAIARHGGDLSRSLEHLFTTAVSCEVASTRVPKCGCHAMSPIAAWACHRGRSACSPCCPMRAWHPTHQYQLEFLFSSAAGGRGHRQDDAHARDSSEGMPSWWFGMLTLLRDVSMAPGEFGTRHPDVGKPTGEVCAESIERAAFWFKMSRIGVLRTKAGQSRGQEIWSDPKSCVTPPRIPRFALMAGRGASGGRCLPYGGSIPIDSKVRCTMPRTCYEVGRPLALELWCRDQNRTINQITIAAMIPMLIQPM
jgi:hypothetical protein